jgi:hypothetical protein
LNCFLNPQDIVAKFCDPEREYDNMTMWFPQVSTPAKSSGQQRLFLSRFLQDHHFNVRLRNAFSALYPQ